MNIGLWIYYLIPESIFESAATVKSTMLHLIHKLCTHVRPIQQHDALPSQYLFMSMRVARAFPDLLESWLVLSYNSGSVSSVIKTSHRSSLRKLQQTQTTAFSVAEVGSQLSLLVSWLLLLVGSQSHGVQVLVVSIVNPILLGALAFLTSSLSHSSELGLPLAIGIFLLTLAAGMVFQRQHHEAPSGMDGPRHTVLPAAADSGGEELTAEGDGLVSGVDAHARMIEDVGSNCFQSDLEDSHDSIIISSDSSSSVSSSGSVSYESCTPNYLRQHRAEKEIEEGEDKGDKESDSEKWSGEESLFDFSFDSTPSEQFSFDSTWS